REHDNLRAALAWDEADEGRCEAGLQLAAALGPFWEMRGYLTEGRRWFAKVLGKSGPAAAALRAKALSWAGDLAADQGDVAAARALYEEGLAIGRELEEKQVIAWSLFGLGAAARDQGEMAAAGSLFGEGLAIWRDLGDRRGIARALRGLGAVAQARDDN